MLPSFNHSQPEVILVVDDVEQNRSVMEQMLTEEGWHVVHAEDGAAALEKFVRLKPDLVLLDVVMPGMSGFEVCRRIKQDPESRLTPVILLTGLSEVEDRVRGIEAGADEFLIRPVERIELVARVHSLLKLKAHTDELERAESVLFALALSIEAKDPYTEGHCARLSDYAVHLGTRLGLSQEYCTALRLAGIVHDIGKVGIPDSILLKPGPLNKDEWEIMKAHPVIGERICAPLKSFGLVLPIIRHHHEKFDGSGYPDGLQSQEIPFTARVLQIVDVFDALVTDRPYRRALPVNKALEIMKSEVEKGWWDKGIFYQFCLLMEAQSTGIMEMFSESISCWSPSLTQASESRSRHL
ncbi:MAG TPA: HD domain-containing phosphohydrolase [Candidatus Angelobacter sp.]|jgi:putative two-component system response regulator|nr:HD domain-containing phosphohydrolase [Candidatus Angelobacter sp.]